MASTAPATPNLGFLMIVHEPTGYVGGYLVTNLWGRPLEFRLSTAVQPNRVQQVLYAGTLEPYICADLIGKTLVEKTSAPAGMVLTDYSAALDLRLRLDVPVVWLARPDDPAVAKLTEAGLCARSAANGRPAVLCHPRFPADVPAVREVLEKVDGMVDPAEPFARIKEAMGEARKMGVTKAA
ncbi:MAG TPA: hypothetical protein VFW33_03510 [Gemmataceae bacterium]|nr:hypothetical protein [Gemmataceae bacterium]